MDELRESRWRLQVSHEVAELRRLALELERNGVTDGPALHGVGVMVEECGERIHKLWDEVTDAAFDAQDRAWAQRRETKGETV